MAAREGHEDGGCFVAVDAVGAFPGSAGLLHHAYALDIKPGAATRSSSRTTRNGGVDASAENGVGSELLAAVVAAATTSYDAHEDGGVLDGDDADDDEDYVPSTSSITVVAAPVALKNGRLPLVTRLDALIQAPEMEQRAFDTWEHFHACLQTYGQTTFQVQYVG